jgi:hypothetical protein
MRDSDLDFTIEKLGVGQMRSPMSGVRFTPDDERVLYHATLAGVNDCMGRGLRRPDRGSDCSSIRRRWPAAS